MTFSNEIYNTDIRLRSLLSWRGIIAGFFTGTLIYALLLFLGIGIAGLGSNILSLDNLTGLSWIGGIWLVLSIAISVFTASFVAVRTSLIRTPQIGMMQGLTTAALFFFMMAIPVGMGMGALTSGAGNFLASTMQASSGIANQPIVKNTIEEALGSLGLEGDKDRILQGVASRLLDGNFESAKNYLIANSNLSTAQADQRIQSISQNFDQAVAEAKDAISATLTAVGWTSFFMLLIGALSGAFAGFIAAQLNLKRVPIKNSRSGTTKREQNISYKAAS